MTARVRLIAVAVATVAAFGVFGGSASADQPAPPNCYGLQSDNGQAAALTLSSIAADTQPGLSGYPVGAFTTQFLQSSCGLHG
jgi:hypothetical protein